MMDCLKSRDSLNALVNVMYLESQKNVLTRKRASSVLSKRSHEIFGAIHINYQKYKGKKPNRVVSQVKKTEKSLKSQLKKKHAAAKALEETNETTIQKKFRTLRKKGLTIKIFASLLAEHIVKQMSNFH